MHFLISSVCIKLVSKVICLCLISLVNLSFGLIIKQIILTCPYYQRCLYLVNVKVVFIYYAQYQIVGQIQQMNQQKDSPGEKISNVIFMVYRHVKYVYQNRESIGLPHNGQKGYYSKKGRLLVPKTIITDKNVALYELFHFLNSILAFLNSILAFHNSKLAFSFLKLDTRFS